MGGISDSDSDEDEPTMPNADDAPKMDPKTSRRRWTRSGPAQPSSSAQEDAEAQKEENAGSPDTGDTAAVAPRADWLKDHGSAEELEAFGMDRLKEELMKNGLKCGGTLAERAQRLFLLRDKTIDEIDAKYKPPVRKEKRRCAHIAAHSLKQHTNANTSNENEITNPPPWLGRTALEVTVLALTA